MINSVTLLGYLGKDPEIRSTQNGARWASFSVATSEHWRDKQSGEKRSKTEWHNVVIWNDGLVGIAEKYLKKGNLVYLQGQLETRKWQDQSGSDRYSTEVVLRFDGKLKLMPKGDGRSGDDRRDDDRDAGNSARRESAAPSRTTNDDLDDHIPF